MVSNHGTGINMSLVRFRSRIGFLVALYTDASAGVDPSSPRLGP